MPKAKTLLDELARTLEARKNASGRLARREDARKALYWQKEEPWFDDEYKTSRKLEEEAFGLYEDLGDRAISEYDKIMRSRPGKRVQQKAWNMMPARLVKEHEYFW